MDPTNTPNPFLSLPKVADPQGSLVTDDPAWKYESSCAAGGGLAHLRVWRTGGAKARGTS
ncbi:hypothetical protein ABT010_33490 [Streptomyces sp. NPDC002668]|uniref:hypothetical protein n=1 Tax=Streptomyces sp. NPDC002668 TaxID=3154422 RepID=UPI003328C2CE